MYATPSYNNTQKNVNHCGLNYENKGCLEEETEAKYNAKYYKYNL